MGVTVWEMVMICSSWDQVTPATPVQGMSRVPDGVRPEEGELAAGLSDLGWVHGLGMHGWPGEMQSQSIIPMYQ